MAARLRQTLVFVVLFSLTLLSSALRDLQASGASPAQVTSRPSRRAKTGPAPGSAEYASADLRVDVPLVLIPVHVTTRLGASVSGLNRENFRLFEDNVEQKITHFIREDAPLSVGLVFDSSSSMRNKLRRSWEAAAEFLKTANREDEFFLIEFSERPKLTVPLTLDVEQVRTRLIRAKAAGRTSLLDAIHLALSQMAHARNLRKAIVILSDGGDNHSRYTEGEIKHAVREADVQIHALGIFDPNEAPRRTPEEQNGPRLLGELADETGGSHFAVEDLDDLPAACVRISDELRNQYVLGYSPTNAALDGRYRRVNVILAASEKTPALNVHHRMGYYAPSR